MASKRGSSRWRTQVRDSKGRWATIEVFEKELSLGKVKRVYADNSPIPVSKNLREPKKQIKIVSPISRIAPKYYAKETIRTDKGDIFFLTYKNRKTRSKILSTLMTRYVFSDFESSPVTEHKYIRLLQED